MCVCVLFLGLSVCVCILYLSHSSTFQSVELLSADLQVMDTHPFYHITQRRIPIIIDTNVSLPEGMEGSRWAVAGRILVRRYEGLAVPLPMPPGKTYYANMRSMLRVPAKPAPLHRYMYPTLLIAMISVF